MAPLAKLVTFVALGSTALAAPALDEKLVKRTGLGASVAMKAARSKSHWPGWAGITKFFPLQVFLIQVRHL